MPRLKDIVWETPYISTGRVSGSDAALSVLMDLRDELKRLNSLLHCSNFVDIPRILRTIRRNTTRRRPRKK